MHGGNDLKFCTLKYLDHLQNWWVYGHCLLIFRILALFWLSETGEIWGFRALPWERMEGMTWNFARWSILTTFRTDEFMATVCWFFLFWRFFDLVKRVKCGVSGHYPENVQRKWPEFCTLMYLEHLQNWLVYGLGFLIFLILALFWLSETGQIWGLPAYPGERIAGNDLKFCMLMYLDHLQNWLVLGHGLL